MEHPRFMISPFIGKVSLVLGYLMVIFGIVFSIIYGMESNIPLAIAGISAALIGLWIILMSETFLALFCIAEDAYEIRSLISRNENFMTNSVKTLEQRLVCGDCGRPVKYETEECPFCGSVKRKFA